MERHKHIGAGAAIGLGLILIGAVIGFDTARMQIPPSYSKVGPNVFPFAAAAGLAACGGFLLYQTLRPGRTPAVPAAERGTDWPAVLLILAALIAQIYLLKLVGFVIIAAGLFYCVAFAFGSRRYLRDGLVALALSLATYLGFTRGLGLQLPAGLLSGLI